jgi:predicted amidohydrolase
VERAPEYGRVPLPHRKVRRKQVDAALGFEKQIFAPFRTAVANAIVEDIRISSVQFENRSGDTAYNLAVIESFSKQAAAEGSAVVAFHECSFTGYTFARSLSKDELLLLAEDVPDGPSIQTLIAIAGRNRITILAGLFEKDSEGRLYNTYVCVGPKGLIARFRKLHPFINSNLTPGGEFCVFDLQGWQCGILICYDNNIIENVRATVLKGANVIFMPHVTMCTTSTRPGAGFVDPSLWKNREIDPTSLRMEFDGLKGRSWLMKWLPARAYDNGIYVVFSNPIGMDDDQLKNGCSMILDPYGDVLVECRRLGDDLCTATLTAEKLTHAGGFRYLHARRPDLYAEIIGRPHQPDQKISWLTQPAE